MPRVSSFIEAVYRELIVVTSGSTSSLSQLRVITETAAHTAYLNNNQIKELIEALQAILPSQPEKQEAKKNSEEVYLAALNILANRLVGERDFSTNEPDLDNCIETQKVAQKALVANAISYAQHYIEQRNEQTARACAATVDSSDSNPAGEVDQVLRAQHTATRGR